MDREPFLPTALMALALSLAGCGNDSDAPQVGLLPEATPTPTPTPTPTATAASLDVTKCVFQQVAPGVTVADLVIPDVIRINPAAPAGFPNGRKPADPVIDITLAVLFLDLSTPGQGPGSFAALPLNPPANDVAFRSGFPFLAPPQGSPPLDPGTGSGFDFRTDPASAYVRVDRTGMPAVSTALIPSDRQNTYNDADPAIDATGEFVPDIANRLTALTQGIGDDLVATGFDICAD